MEGARNVTNPLGIGKNILLFTEALYNCAVIVGHFVFVIDKVVAEAAIALIVPVRGAMIANPCKSVNWEIGQLIGKNFSLEAAKPNMATLRGEKQDEISNKTFPPDENGSILPTVEIKAGRLIT